MGLWITLAGIAVAIALLALLTRPLRSMDQHLTELERAFRRTRRPLAPGVTLAELERQLRESPAAAAYVRRLRLNRFAGDARTPSTPERRALRAHLAVGLGLSGTVRAWLALPPRRRGLARPRGA
jgi:hypothetical protein